MRPLPLFFLLFTTTPLLAAEVRPVPDEVTPERIEDATPRSVVFILSDDHRYDAMSFLGHQFAETPFMDSLAKGEETPWRNDFLYVYYWEKNFPQSPTVFALRGDRYKYITYYGLWDLDELYDLEKDPGESTNLIHDAGHAEIAARMEKRLYERMEELGGMEIPLNAPRGRSHNKRLRSRGGEEAADFPEAFVVDEPLNRNAK